MFVVFSVIDSYSFISWRVFLTVHFYHFIICETVSFDSFSIRFFRRLFVRLFRPFFVKLVVF